MGTGKSGRYLGTAGSRTRASEYAVVHSNEGTFIRSGKRHDRLRLKGGCHGQDGIDLLDKYHIAYTITKTYPNGVRVGNVPWHADRRKQTGSGQSWFPSSWSDRAIKSAGEHVAKLKRNRGAGDGIVIRGRYRGVTVCVIMTNGQIGTIFPDRNQ